LLSRAVFQASLSNNSALQKHWSVAIFLETRSGGCFCLPVEKHEVAKNKPLSGCPERGLSLVPFPVFHVERGW
jgi:hypothetical protein